MQVAIKMNADPETLSGIQNKLLAKYAEGATVAEKADALARATLAAICNGLLYSYKDAVSVRTFFTWASQTVDCGFKFLPDGPNNDLGGMLGGVQLDVRAIVRSFPKLFDNEEFRKKFLEQGLKHKVVSAVFVHLCRERRQPTNQLLTRLAQRLYASFGTLYSEQSVGRIFLYRAPQVKCAICKDCGMLGLHSRPAQMQKHGCYLRRQQRALSNADNNTTVST